MDTKEKKKKKYFFVMRSLRIYSQQLSYIMYSSPNTSIYRH